MGYVVLRRLLPVLLFMIFVPAVGQAQFADETQNLFDVSPSTVDRTTNQVVIEFKNEEIIEDVEAEETTDVALCCELPAEERAASDICVNVVCPEAP